MTIRPLRLIALAALWFGSACTAGAAPIQSLELGIVRAAPDVVKHLKEKVGKGPLNVGVLKFRVRKGKGPLSDNVGSLNLDLARRLELALIYAVKIDDPMNVIRNASAVAAKLKGANHLTEAGRARLFEGKYQQAWGQQNSPASADAFLTGEVQWEADLRDMTVTIFCFDNKNKKPSDLIEVARFKARAGANVLALGGAPFLLRGPQGEAAATRSAARMFARKEPHPLAANGNPWVKLEILYNKTPVPVEGLGEGQARIPEPLEDQTVTFVLQRTDAAGAERMAVVLKVNGENTLFREHDRASDFVYTKWILDRARPLTIEGYNTDKEVAEKFKVVSRRESTGEEMDYGPDPGTISLVVYREQGKGIPPITFQATKKEQELALLLSQGVYPEERAETRAGLRMQFQDQIQKRGNRGVIKPGGEKVRSRLTEVPFVADPTPIQSVRIVYYRSLARSRK